MDQFTYLLTKSSEVNSNHYYNRVHIFTDEVLAKWGNITRTIVEPYHTYVQVSEGKDNLSKEESLLEFMILGVLMRVYAKEALKLGKMQHRVLSQVNRIREKNEKLKPVLNLLKGIMSTLFLSFDDKQDETTVTPNLQNLNKLMLWLEATGEFNHELKRLRKWENYLHTLPAHSAIEIMTVAIKFAGWFEGRSEEVLGVYTYGVDHYLEATKNKNGWREDRILRRRKRVEHHLNMVGAELMSNAFRKDFMGMPKKILVLPLCMTHPFQGKCQSETFGKTFQCKSCSNKCQINQLTRLEEKWHFHVIVVPHESSIASLSQSDDLFDQNTGVIGVACVLNLISGGWMLKDIGVPSQCVLLDYCGCKSHWQDKDIPTCINLDKLEKLLRS